MINKEFINTWSNKYDENVSKRDKELEEKIRSEITHLLQDRKVKHITRDILYDIVDWKAPRIRKNVLKNRKEFAEEVTKRCFLSPDEQFKIEVLTILKGIQYRVASAILHFCFSSEYTIMDSRAWWSLREKKELQKDYKIKDDFEHWQRYLNVCRKISHKYDCSLRQLDKALWQYSKENQK